jgi:hypothetical protein
MQTRYNLQQRMQLRQRSAGDECYPGQLWTGHKRWKRRTSRQHLWRNLASRPSLEAGRRPLPQQEQKTLKSKRKAKMVNLNQYGNDPALKLVANGGRMRMT